MFASAGGLVGHSGFEFIVGVEDNSVVNCVQQPCPLHSKTRLRYELSKIQKLHQNSFSSLENDTKHAPHNTPFPREPTLLEIWDVAPTQAEKKKNCGPMAVIGIDINANELK